MAGLATPPEHIVRSVLSVLALISLCALIGLRAPEGPFRSNFWSRFKTLMVLTTLFIGAAVLGGVWWAALITVLLATAQGGLLTASGLWSESRPASVLGLLGGLGLCVASHLFGLSGLALAAMASTLLLCAIARGLGKGWAHSFGLAGTLLYVGGLGGFIVVLEQSLGFPGVMLFLALVMLSDLGAYLCGKRYGRSKLAPRLSPGKTWEGLAGGLALAQFGLFVFGFLFPQLSHLQLVVAGMLVTLAALLGDLLASTIKRSLGLDDFSALLPGHGGVLDRFDGYLMAAPVVWWAFGPRSELELGLALALLAALTAALVHFGSNYLDTLTADEERP